MCSEKTQFYNEEADQVKMSSRRFLSFQHSFISQPPPLPRRLQGSEILWHFWECLTSPGNNTATTPTLPWKCNSLCCAVELSAQPRINHQKVKLQTASTTSPASASLYRLAQESSPDRGQFRNIVWYIAAFTLLSSFYHQPSLCQPL
jgi:hypothetical protein